MALYQNITNPKTDKKKISFLKYLTPPPPPLSIEYVPEKINFNI